jgi:hypothetical protein
MARPLRFIAGLRRLPLEAYVWTAALAALAWTDPRADGLLSLCVPKALGLPFCPGCGLGHAIAHLFRGELALSLAAHPLGPFAAAVLGARVVSLGRDAFRRPPPGAPCVPSLHP